MRLERNHAGGFRGTIVKATVSAIIIALGASYTSQVIANDQSTPRVAFFGFQLINTSLQSTAPEEAQRIRSLDDTFQRKLNASGRFQLIAIPTIWMTPSQPRPSRIAMAANATSH
jgi:hypothetical protein